MLFQDAAARQLGLTATELETFRLLQHQEPITASELAAQTGLTRASMSAIVERLATKELLTREQDTSDRRRWLLRTNRSAIDLVDGIYTRHAHRVERLLDQYDEAEFTVVLRFLDELADELQASAVELGADR